jgi:hypothetical protein
MTGDAVRQPRTRAKTLAGRCAPDRDFHNVIVSCVLARNGDLASFTRMAARDDECGITVAL